MKTLIALLASTSICYAASLGVSEGQLRGSLINPRSDMTTPTQADEPTSTPPKVWQLVGMFIKKDGTPEGIEVSRAIAEFLNEDECRAAVAAHQEEAQRHLVTLDCRQ